MATFPPYRGTGPGRPSSVPLPPAKLPLLLHGRMRKRWRYVGVFGPELSVCVGVVHVGPFRQVFWAVWDREHERLTERTTTRGTPVRLPPGRVQVEDGDVRIDLAFAEDPEAVDDAPARLAGALFAAPGGSPERPDRVETVTPYGRGYAWTAKRAGVPVRGTVRVGDRTIDVDALAVVDDSAGYPPRHTAWNWSAGVGEDERGRRVAWNLVDGIHDDPAASERGVWIDGVARHVAPVRFAKDLTGVRDDPAATADTASVPHADPWSTDASPAPATGTALVFRPEAMRERNENRIVVRSRYEQPFGSFSGRLPGGVTLRWGRGVMERHAAVW